MPNHLVPDYIALTAKIDKLLASGQMTDEQLRLVLMEHIMQDSFNLDITDTFSKLSVLGFSVPLDVTTSTSPRTKLTHLMLAAEALKQSIMLQVYTSVANDFDSKGFEEEE